MNSVRPKRAPGFYEDSKKLITMFIDLLSVRFVDFAKVWRTMKFSYVFMGREKSEANCFTEECFAILTSQLTVENDFNYKCGLLYTLYGMYMKQISDPKVKIRLTMDHFKELGDIFRRAESEMHLDVCYIFLFLFFEGAFHFVCHQTTLGPRRNNFVEANVTVVDHFPNPDLLKDSVWKTYLDEDYVDQMTAFHEQYEAMKETQQNPDVHSLKMVTTDAFKETKKVIRKLERNYRTEQNCEESDSDESEVESTSTRRAAIRERQFEVSAGVSRSRRHRQVVADEASSTQSSDN